MLRYWEFVKYTVPRAARLAWHLIKANSFKSGKLLPLKHRNNRITTCLDCPSKKFDESMLECTECKCLVILKATWEDESCPHDHW